MMPPDKVGKGRTILPDDTDGLIAPEKNNRAQNRFHLVCALND
ncbi:hypothetical protein [Thalassospira sp.]